MAVSDNKYEPSAVVKEITDDTYKLATRLKGRNPQEKKQMEYQINVNRIKLLLHYAEVLSPRFNWRMAGQAITQNLEAIKNTKTRKTAEKAIAEAGLKLEKKRLVLLD